MSTTNKLNHYLCGFFDSILLASIISTLQKAVAAAVLSLYNDNTDAAKVQVNTTPPDFTGDYSVVVFPFVKISKKAPDATASEIGTYLQENVPEIKGWNVVKGFLNLEIADAYWNNFLSGLLADADYGRQPRNGHRLMVEYSSPIPTSPCTWGTSAISCRMVVYPYHGCRRRTIS
jgi:arginyl-tRNA synthetase